MEQIAFIESNAGASVFGMPVDVYYTASGKPTWRLNRQLQAIRRPVRFPCLLDQMRKAERLAD